MRADELLLELAGRLVTASTGAPNRAGYLVRGLVVDTSFPGDWSVATRPAIVDGSVASGAVRITIPSAFDCHLRLADYVGAQRLVEQCPELFDSPSLLGWKAVVRGHVWPESATDAFDEAATHFHSESAEGGGRWSSYFRALSLLAAARADPTCMADHLRRAAEALPLLDEAGALGENGEDPTREALARLVAEGLEAVAVHPPGEAGARRLASVMEALRRLPHVRETSHPIGPAINLKVHTLPLPPISTGLHNALALVHDEDMYQRLLFRVVQAWALVHADVVQGPVRSGRNVALLLRQNGELVLRLFRAVAGGSRMATWGEVRSEVEEIFRSPLKGLAPMVGPVRRTGTLVMNSRLAEEDRSELAAWAGRLRRAFGPEAEVMDLDDYVQWIVRDRLVNDLRAALAEPAF